MNCAPCVTLFQDSALHMMADSGRVKSSWNWGKKRRRSSLSAFVRLLVGFAIIAFLVWKTDLLRITEFIGRLDPVWLAVAFGIQLTAKFGWALR